MLTCDLGVDYVKFNSAYSSYSVGCRQRFSEKTDGHEVEGAAGFPAAPSFRGFVVNYELTPRSPEAS